MSAIEDDCKQKTSFFYMGMNIPVDNTPAIQKMRELKQLLLTHKNSQSESIEL